MKLSAFSLALTLLSVLLSWNGFVVAQARRVESQGQHQVTVKHSDVQGRVSTVGRESLTRLREPLRTPNVSQPVHRPGYRCYWHPGYGRYLYFPEATVIQGVRTVGDCQVLPDDYGLPEQVLTYEAPRAVTVVCPRCGTRLTVQVQ